MTEKLNFFVKRILFAIFGGVVYSAWQCVSIWRMRAAPGALKSRNASRGEEREGNNAKEAGNVNSTPWRSIAADATLR